jgi:hypothetical protein
VSTHGESIRERHGVDILDQLGIDPVDDDLDSLERREVLALMRSASSTNGKARQRRSLAMRASPPSTRRTRSGGTCEEAMASRASWPGPATPTVTVPWNRSAAALGQPTASPARVRRLGIQEPGVDAGGVEDREL